MQNVIIATYLFPPAGGKAVQRVSKLVKYLPAFGWNPIVFTMPLIHVKEVTDQSLFDELPPDIEIHRPRFTDWWSFIPHDIRKLLYHPLPDRHISWARGTIGDLVRLIADTDARALITTSPSHSTQMLGLAAKQATDIPWIADFRDQWTGHPDFAPKRGTQQLCLMEREVLSGADAATVAAPCAKRDFTALIPEDRITVIENGYDPEDFFHIDPKRETNNTPVLHIGYNGTVRPIEDPTVLLSAAAGLLDTGVIGEDDLRLVFTGNMDMKLFRPFASLMDRGVVEVHGYTPHDESLTRMASMDVSLLLLTKGRDIYPAKVFEYFYLGNPVFHLGTPGDDLSRLIEQTGSGRVADYRDREAVATQLGRFINEKKQGTLHRLPSDRPEIGKFSRRVIAGRFSDLLAKIID